jgi:hypothetical protein
MKKTLKPAEVLRPVVADDANAPNAKYRCTGCNKAARDIGGAVEPGCHCGVAIAADMTATAYGVASMRNHAAKDTAKDTTE